jgi:WD40 repeat protein
MLEEFGFNKKTITINNITKIAFSKDGQYMITGSNNNLVQIFDTTTGALIHNLPPTQTQYSVTAIAISPDEQKIAFSSSNAVIRIWDRNTNTYIHNLTGQNSSLIFTPDGQAIISSSTLNEQIIFFDINTGNKLFTLGKGHHNGIQALALSSDGLKLVSAGGTRDTTTRIWDVNANSVLEMIEQPTVVSCIAFSPDNQLIVCGYASPQLLHIFDVNTKQLINRSNKIFKTSSIAFSPDGLYIAAGDFVDNHIYLFNANDGKIIMTLVGHTERVTLIMFNLIGNKLMTFSRQVIIYEKIVNAVVEPNAFSYIPVDAAFYVGDDNKDNRPGAYNSQRFVRQENLIPVLKSNNAGKDNKTKGKRSKRSKRNNNKTKGKRSNKGKRNNKTNKK